MFAVAHHHLLLARCFAAPDWHSNRRFLASPSEGGIHRAGDLAFRPSCSTLTARNQGFYDPELRLVLELATDDELFELENILYGPSYFSPLLKSISTRPDADYALDVENFEAREDFIDLLETRFLFLAADARSTLRGWRPSYRTVLLSVRKKLGIQCSSKLLTEDLEAEVFHYLLQEYSSEWKVNTLAPLRVEAKVLKRTFFKGGGMFVLTKICQLLTRNLSGKMLLEAANYEMKHELVKRGGQLAVINLESRAALLTARQGLLRAASRYLGLRSLMTLMGPMLWGTFLADVVIQMLGTDYARILRAICAFAQIRLTRTQDWTSGGL